MNDAPSDAPCNQSDPHKQLAERDSRRALRNRAAQDWLAPNAAEQMRVLKLVRETIELHHEALDDPDVMLILAEGETSLLEVIDCMLIADLNDETLVQGLKAAKDTMSARLHRLEERRKSRRVILEQALLLLERKSLERPSATLVLAERPSTLLVEEEAKIPTRFFDLKPVLNRRLAKDALEAGEEVPGARLSGGLLTLSVRRR